MCAFWHRTEAAPGFQSWGAPGQVVVDLPPLPPPSTPLFIQKISDLREFHVSFRWRLESRPLIPRPPPSLAQDIYPATAIDMAIG